MIKFLRQHKTLFLFLVLSVATIVCSLCWNVEKYPIALLLSQIAVGYVINFIFYVTLSYWPSKRKIDVANKIISRKIEQIISNIKAFPEAMMKQFPSEFSSRKERVRHATFGYYSELILEHAGLCLLNSGKYKKWKAGNYLYTKTRLVEDDMDFILKYYSEAVLPELDEVFDKIRHTSVHTALKMMHECNRQYTNSSDSIVEYDELTDELEKVKQLYK